VSGRLLAEDGAHFTAVIKRTEDGPERPTRDFLRWDGVLFERKRRWHSEFMAGK
jgi:hypothetical protein